MSMASKSRSDAAQYDRTLTCTCHRQSPIQIGDAHRRTDPCFGARSSKTADVVRSVATDGRAAPSGGLFVGLGADGLFCMIPRPPCHCMLRSSTTLGGANHDG